MVADRTKFSAPYVVEDSGRLQAALLVRPSFAIETLPPVQGEASPIAGRAQEQHALLETRLRAHGVSVVSLESDSASAASFAVGDIALMLGDGAVMMRPSDLGRRSEIAVVESALGDAGIPIVGRIEPPGLLDGADVLLGSDSLFVAAPFDRPSAVGISRIRRGNPEGRRQLAAIANERGLKTIEVSLASDVRRLRSVASFIDRGTVLLASPLAAADAFAPFERIAVALGEDYGAGALTFGKRSILENLRFRTTLPMLRRQGVAVDAIDLWEFGKLGITPSALVLALKRG
ncbi:MAG: hypothetical protein JO060_08735 [Candidatus Eremiobacteraeota bacterium]|nr:hypothetical protein [Candidatus Eremiobacteraeota bacterium]MBV9647168.1 hypothetical protein [Candidatus Eremiobacteraeota bacterium]